MARTSKTFKMRSGEYQSTDLDYCRRCYAKQNHSILQSQGYDIAPEHPDYADDDYTCADCKRPLTSADN